MLRPLLTTAERPCRMLARQCMRVASSSSSVTTTSGTISRTQYPEEPRVGVGVVVLRPSPVTPSLKEVLLIKRGKPPSLHQWSFPGGSLDLGETVVECAVRECLEETGIQLQVDPGLNPYARTDDFLRSPRPFTAADVIARDDNGQIEFQYAIIEVAGVPVPGSPDPIAATDVEDARWFPVDSLADLPDVVKNLPEIAQEAARRFQLD